MDRENSLNRKSSLELFMFAVDDSVLLAAETTAISGVIVDWERNHKDARQKGRDTQINHHTVADLDRVVAATQMPVTVRINGLPDGEDEIEVALDHGARQLMLPMAESARDVERFLQLVRGRAETLIQIETQSLVNDCEALNDLEWDRAFIGLNDLMISRGGHWLWEGLYDGTVDHVCSALRGRQLGFGGVTIIGGGQPLRLTDLLREYGRLGCSFSFLRRTFFREIMGRNLDLEMTVVHAMWRAVVQRSARAVANDHAEFRARLAAARADVMSTQQSHDLIPSTSHANPRDVRAL